MSRRTSKQKMQLIEQEFDWLIRDLPVLLKKTRNLNVDAGKVKAGLVWLKHNMPEQTYSEHEAENLIAGLMESIIDQRKLYERKKKTVVGGPVMNRMALTVKWLSDLGDNTPRVRKWEQECRTKEFKRFAQQYLDESSDVYDFDWAHYQAQSQARLNKELGLPPDPVLNERALSEKAVSDNLPDTPVVDNTNSNGSYKPSRNKSKKGDESTHSEDNLPDDNSPGDGADSEGENIIYFDKNLALSKDAYLRQRLLNQFLNDKNIQGEIEELVFEHPSGLFKAVKDGGFRPEASYADIVLRVKVKNPDGTILVIRNIRIEEKAWYNSTFSFSSAGDALSSATHRSDIIQGYRYLLESVFIERDMTSLRYAIPAVTSDTGIKPDHIRKMLLQTMDHPDGKKFTRELLGGDGAPAINMPAKFDDPKNELLNQAFRKSVEENDPSILNIMQNWDKILKENPNQFPDCAAFGSKGSSVNDQFKAMKEQLDTHLTPKPDFNSGIILVDAEFPSE